MQICSVDQGNWHLRHDQWPVMTCYDHQQWAISYYHYSIILPSGLPSKLSPGQAVCISYLAACLTLFRGDPFCTVQGWIVMFRSPFLVAEPLSSPGRLKRSNSINQQLHGKDLEWLSHKYMYVVIDFAAAWPCLYQLELLGCLRNYISSNFSRET